MKPLILERPTPDPALKLRERMEAQRLIKEGMGEREAALQARLRHRPAPD